LGVRGVNLATIDEDPFSGVHVSLTIEETLELVGVVDDRVHPALVHQFIVEGAADVGVDVLPLVLDHPLATTLRHLEGDIGQANALAVADHLPRAIHFRLNRKEFLVQVEVNTDFHGAMILL